MLEIGSLLWCGDVMCQIKGHKVALKVVPPPTTQCALPNSTSQKRELYKVADVGQDPPDLSAATLGN